MDESNMSRGNGTEFWGVTISKDDPAELSPAGSAELQLTMVAMRSNKPGKYQIMMTADDEGPYTLCWLDASKGVMHEKIDYLIGNGNSVVKIEVKGGDGEIDITGYMTYPQTGFDDDDEGAFFDEEDDEDDDDEDEQLLNGKGMDDEDDDDEDDDDDEEEVLREMQSAQAAKKNKRQTAAAAAPQTKRAKLQAAAEEDDDEDDDDDDDFGLRNSEFGSGMGDEDDDDEDEDDEEEEEEEEEESEEEELPPPPPKKKGQAAKAAPPKAPPKATTPAKKAGAAATPQKAEKAPAKTPGKVGGVKPEGSGAAVEYKKLLTDFIKASGGKATMSKVGSAVKKPQGVAEKMGAFLKANPSVFKISNNEISLV